MTPFLKKLLYCGVVILSTTISAQAQISIPQIQWAKSFGGSESDFPSAIELTSDKGYIIAGGSYSSDFDIAGHHGTTDFSDFWIVKLDSNGVLEWQRSLGGDSDDVARSIKQTKDGGYILAGYSNSKNWDVSGNHGGYDYWIVKLDENGKIIWQRSYGGTGDDKAFSVELSSDDGYVIAGTSYSNDMDVTGHHGSAGSADCWVIKLNSVGELQWEKSFGGTQDDAANEIKRTSDNGFIIAAYLTSMHDFTAIKIDSLGNEKWESSVGGSGDEEAFSIDVTKDGGFILAGYSDSKDGAVTGNHGNTDYWIVKLDSVGKLLWQKSFGGSDAEAAYSIKPTFDAGFIIAGISSSNDFDVSGNHGGNDYWLVKLDSIGNLQWQKSLGGPGEEFALCVRQTSDSGYVIAGSSDFDGGDVTDNHNHEDFWVVKLGTQTMNDVKAVKSSSNEAINFPNPFNEKTQIQFSYAIESPSEFILYNILGEEVKRLKISSGTESISFSRENLASGIYVYHVVSSGRIIGEGRMIIQ